MSTEGPKPVAIVTGGTRGIGRAISVTLATAGYHIVATYHANRASADASRSEIEDAGGSIETVAFDVADPEQAGAAMQDITSRHDAIEVLVNNAGITADDLFLMMKASKWDSVIDVALKGFYDVTKPVIKKMIRRKKGSIVTISSVSGNLPGGTPRGGQRTSAFPLLRGGLLHHRPGDRRQRRYVLTCAQHRYRCLTRGRGCGGNAWVAAAVTWGSRRLCW